MLLFAGTFIAFILGLAIIIFILRLFSSTLLHVPGFDKFFEYMILAIPYLIFYAAYYCLYKNIPSSNSRPSKTVTSILLILGLLICSAGLVLSTIFYAGVRSHWLNVYNENSGYGLTLQLALALITAGVIAAGGTKEKDWRERRSGGL